MSEHRKKFELALFPPGQTGEAGLWVYFAGPGEGLHKVEHPAGFGKRSDYRTTSRAWLSAMEYWDGTWNIG